MKRGEVYWVNLDPKIGSEIQKRRPCVLLGATPVNLARRTVVVVPLSSSSLVRPPLTVSVQFSGMSGVAVCDQIRAVDKSRLLEPAGPLAPEDLRRIEEALRLILCL